MIIGKIGKENFKINPQKLITGRTCVVGITGSGKSYAVAVICEELCKQGFGFCIVDTEGEYFSLKKKYEILWIGNDERCDLNINEINLKEILRTAVEKSVPVIFDTSDLMNEKQEVSKLCKYLYEIESKIKTPYLLIIEEVDKFSPQRGDKIKDVEVVARRGRKRGLGLMIATQRTSFVDKNLLSQCNNQVIGKLSIKNDIDSVRLFFEDRKDLAKLPDLNPGEFFIMGGINKNQTSLIKFRQRETPHGAVTPWIKVKKPVVLKELIPKIKKEAAKTIKLPHNIQSLEKVKKYSKKFEKKKYVLFGEIDKIKEVQLNFYPLINAEIKTIKKDLFKERINIFNILFDGISGIPVKITKGIKFLNEFNKIVGLSREEFLFLKALKKESTVNKLCKILKTNESSARKTINLLQNKKFITFTGKEGREKKYKALATIKIPGLNKLNNKTKFKETKLKGKVINPKEKEEHIQKILKTIEPTAQIVSSFTLYYPVYLIKKKRNIVLDGLSLKEIKDLSGL